VISLTVADQKNTRTKTQVEYEIWRFLLLFDYISGKTANHRFIIINHKILIYYRQESRAVARKPRDAAAVLFSLKFADDIHYKFKSSQASSQASELQTYRHKT